MSKSILRDALENGCKTQSELKEFMFQEKRQDFLDDIMNDPDISRWDDLDIKTQRKVIIYEFFSEKELMETLYASNYVSDDYGDIDVSETLGEKAFEFMKNMNDIEFETFKSLGVDRFMITLEEV